MNCEGGSKGRGVNDNLRESKLWRQMEGEKEGGGAKKEGGKAFRQLRDDRIAKP